MHDDEIAQLSILLEGLSLACSCNVGTNIDPSKRKIALRRLLHLQKKLATTIEAINDVEATEIGSTDTFVIEQHEADVHSYRYETKERFNSYYPSTSRKTMNLTLYSPPLKVKRLTSHSSCAN